VRAYHFSVISIRSALRIE